MTSLQPINGYGEPKSTGSQSLQHQSINSQSITRPLRQNSINQHLPTVRHKLRHDLHIGRIYNARVTETLAERSRAQSQRTLPAPNRAATGGGQPTFSAAQRRLCLQIKHSTPARLRLGLGAAPQSRPGSAASPAHPRTLPQHPEASSSPDAAAKQATDLPARAYIPSTTPVCASSAGSCGSRLLGSLGREAVVGSASSGGQCCLERVGFSLLQISLRFQCFLPRFSPSKQSPCCHLRPGECRSLAFPHASRDRLVHTHPPFLSPFPKAQVSWSLVRVCVRVCLLLRVIKSRRCWPSTFSEAEAKVQDTI